MIQKTEGRYTKIESAVRNENQVTTNITDNWLITEGLLLEVNSGNVSENYSREILWVLLCAP